MEDKKEIAADPPDGGWGWVVVLAGFIGVFLSAGLPYSFGVLYVAFLNAFGETKAATAWVSGTSAITAVLSMGFSVPLARRFGHRKVIMAGGVLASLGIFASSFATDLYQVYLTYGLVTGVGLGLSYVTFVEIISIYFRKRFPIALGLALSGTGAGQLVLSITFQMLVDHYGWRGALIILSAIMAHLCVSAALLRPLKVGRLSKDYKYERSDVARTIVMDTINNKEGLTDDTKMLDAQTPTDYQTSDRTCNASLKTLLTAIYDVSLLKNPLFLVLVLIHFGQSCGVTTFQVHLVRRARDLGIPDTQSAYVPAAMGLAQIFGRTFFGALGHFNQTKPYVVYSILTAVCGIAVFVSTYTTTFTGQLVFVLVSGSCMGGFVVYTSIVLKHFLGNEKIGHGLSLLMHVTGACVLLFGPFGGWLRDTTNVYDWTFWVTGALLLLAAGLALLLPVVERIIRRKQLKEIIAKEQIT